MTFQHILNGLFAFVIIAMGVVALSLNDRIKRLEAVVSDGGIYAEFVKTRRVSVVNMNHREVVTLDSDRNDSSGFGDGILTVNEGQGLKDPNKQITASVQIRANAQVGGLVSAQSHRIYQTTDDGRLKLIPIHDTPSSEREPAPVEPSGSPDAPDTP